jgi:hypothetical protein
MKPHAASRSAGECRAGAASAPTGAARRPFRSWIAGRIERARRRWAIAVFAWVWPRGIPVLCRGIEAGPIYVSTTDPERERRIRRLHRVYFPRAVRSGRSISELSSDIAFALEMQGLEG